MLIEFQRFMRRTVLLAAVLALIFSGRVLAQPTVSVRGNVGAAFLQGPNSLNTVFNSGVDLGLETGIQLYEGLELVVQGSYDRFSLNEDNVLLNRDLRPGEGAWVEGGDFYFLNASVGLRYMFVHQGNAHPYITAGTGLYRTTFTEFKVFHNGTLQNADSGNRQVLTSSGMHVGLGVNFQIDETYSFFFEPRYVVVFTDDNDLGLTTSLRYVPFRLGLDMRF